MTTRLALGLALLLAAGACGIRGLPRPPRPPVQPRPIESIATPDGGTLPPSDGGRASP